MTKEYWDNKIADLTLRIANMDALRQAHYNAKRFQMAKCCERELKVLQNKMKVAQEERRIDTGFYERCSVEVVEDDETSSI